MTHQDSIGIAPSAQLKTTRLRVLLSLRYLGVRVLAIQPILHHFLDHIPKSKSFPDEHQLRLLRALGAILLADLVQACRGMLHISKGLVAVTKIHQNLLGTWWFSYYYMFTFALTVLGVIAIKRIPAHS